MTRQVHELNPDKHAPLRRSLDRPACIAHAANFLGQFLTWQSYFSANEGGSGDDDEQPGGSSEADGSSAVLDAREQRHIDRAAARQGRAAALRVRLEG